MKHDCCEGRHWFGSDVTIQKECLDPHIKPLPLLIVNNTESVRVQGKSAVCNFVGSHYIKQSLRRLRILFLVVQKYKLGRVLL